MESYEINSEVHASYKMSWTAYIKPALIFLVFFAIGRAVMANHTTAGAIVILAALLLFVFQVLNIRSVLLYTDDNGVWVFRGILPWSKGISGVKWRDLEDASYFPNFISWALKSYTIRVGHRFTKTSEIILPHIARGHDAAMHINELHNAALSNFGNENTV